MPRVPDGSIIYAVGDIHGRLDLLEGVLRELGEAADVAARERAKLVTIFLGDYIDKGPNSPRVLDRLIELRDERLCETIFLRGNHEQVLLDLIDGAEATARWLDYGGRETMVAYGVDAVGRDLGRLRPQVQRAVPAHHVAFLRETQMSAVKGDYFFVHAGLRPDRLIEEQTDADMLWFRYYDDAQPVWDYTVVHGHSPNDNPVLGRWRIGIDTAAYATGALTLLRLQGDRQDLLKISVGKPGGVAQTSTWRDADRSYRPPAEGRSRSRTRKSAGRAAEPSPKRRPSMLRRLFAGLGGLALISAAGVGAYLAGWGGSHGGLSDPRGGPDAGGPAPAARSAEPDAGAAVFGATATDPAVSPASLEGVSAAPAPAASTPPAATSGFLVQIAAAPDQAAASRAWRELVAAMPEATAGRSMSLEAVQSGPRTLQRVLVGGFSARAEAETFCQTLRDAKRSCLVRGAGPTVGAASPEPALAPQPGALARTARVGDEG